MFQTKVVGKIEIHIWRS